MQPIKPTWSIAKQISRRHTMVSALITFGIMLIGLGILTGVFLWFGYELSLKLYGDFIYQYGGLITAVIMPIHLIPVNFYAIIRVLQHPFKEFRIVVYDISESAATEKSADGELPTVTE